MTTTREPSSEIDVLYEFALGYQHPDPQRLDEFAKAYPAQADALTTLAIELALERASGQPMPSDAPLDHQAEVLLSKAMSHFQNRLYAIRTAQAAEQAERTATLPRDLFASRTREQMQTLGKRLDVSPLFLRRLRDCEIRADTLTPGFVRAVAEALEEPQIEVSHYFARRAPHFAPNVFYKSSVSPTAGRQLTFDEAVRNSGLTPEQQARLLAL